MHLVFLQALTLSLLFVSSCWAGVSVCEDMVLKQVLYFLEQQPADNVGSCSCLCGLLHVGSCSWQELLP